MSRPTPPPADHEYERLNPGAHADPAQPKPEESRSKSNADLPGSQNADLRGAKRDRTFRGATT